MRREPSARAETWLIAAVALVFVLSARGYIQVADTNVSIATAERLVSAGRLDIPRIEGATLTGANGLSYSKYGIGLPLYYVPIVAASRILSRLTGFDPRDLSGFLVSLANIPFAVLALVAFGRALRVLGTGDLDRRLLILALGLGSLFWRYAVYDFSEMAQLSLLMVAVYGVIRGTTRSLTAGGIAFAALVLVKVSHAVVIPVFAAFLLASLPPPRWRRAFVAFGVPIICAVGFIGVLNVARFGRPFETGYGAEAYQFIPSQVPYSLPALLVSADKGLLIFSPVIILGLAGWTVYVRHHRREAALCGAIIVAELLIAAAWHDPGGGWCWGPRLLVPTLPLWLLPAGRWLSAHPHGRRHAVAAGVLAISTALQIPGVLIRDHQIHQIKHNELTRDERPFAHSDYRMAWALLFHKARTATEVYDVREFGVPGDRWLDLTGFETFRGLDIWTEHAARRYHSALIRWLPVAALPLIASFVLASRGTIRTRTQRSRQFV